MNPYDRLRREREESERRDWERLQKDPNSVTYWAKVWFEGFTEPIRRSW